MHHAAPRTFNGFAGPITGMLVHTGKRIEYGAFSGVWIAEQGNDKIIRTFCQKHFITCMPSGAAVCQTQIKPPQFRGCRSGAVQ